MGINSDGLGVMEYSCITSTCPGSGQRSPPAIPLPVRAMLKVITFNTLSSPMSIYIGHVRVRNVRLIVTVELFLGF